MVPKPLSARHGFPPQPQTRVKGKASLSLPFPMNREILDALPAHIAIIDAKGVISFVNKLWKRFANRNGFTGTNHGIGINYLQICKKAHGYGAKEAQAVGRGLKAVLAGKLESFALEYPAHISDEERWFRVMISRFFEAKKTNAVVMHLDITEGRQAQEALKKEEQFIDKILDTAGALVVVLDRAWRIVQFNRVCEKMIGRTLEDMRGKSFLDLSVISGESAPDVKHLLTSFKWKQFPAFFENTWLDRNRQLRWISWSNTAIKDNQGEIENIIATGIDITERKQAEREIQRLSIQNTLILNSAGEGIYGLDLQGKATFVNPAAANMLGYQPQELLGKPMHETVHHSKPDGLPYQLKNCPVHAALKDGAVHHVASEVLWRKDGTSFPVEYTSTPILGKDDIIEGAVVTFKDIIERKKAEKALQESEERFQAFMNHSPAVAFLKNTKGQYLYVNKPFETLLHKSSVECLGKTDYQLFPPEIARTFKEHDQDTLKNGGVLETEETTLDEKGNIRFWWVMKFLVHRKTGQPLLGGVALDITSRKRAEEALRQREAELQGSHEALQALGGQLISAQEDERRRISRELHDDMNQRLAVLALNIQTAQMELGTTAPMFKTFQKLYDGVSMLSDDVRHLAYQLHPSILDDLGLEVALRSFIDDFSKWENIPVAFVATDLPLSLSPEIASCLYRVTQECLRNVVRHAEASQVEVTLAKVEEGLRLSIKDDGKGFTVKSTQTGKAGLGLIGMQERVRVIQGNYEVASVPGQGTEITVWVPVPKEGWF